MHISIMEGTRVGHGAYLGTWAYRKEICLWSGSGYQRAEALWQQLWLRAMGFGA